MRELAERDDLLFSLTRKRQPRLRKEVAARCNFADALREVVLANLLLEKLGARTVSALPASRNL
jgi:hypothetical protein